MLSGYRFRAYPTPTQAAVLRLWIGHQRFVYNAKVGEADYFRTFARKSLSLTGQQPFPDQAYSQFKSELTPWLKDVPSQVLRNGAYRYASASTRCLRGLGGAPAIRRKHGRQSVLITSELFAFTPKTHARTGEVTQALTIGSAKCPIGALEFKAHRAYSLPKMLVVSVEPSGAWFVSFCSEMPEVPGAAPRILRTPTELAYEFGLRADLETIVAGIDRGIVIPVATSDLGDFHVPPVCLARIKKKEARAHRYQRRMAGQVLGSKNRGKMRQRIAKLKVYGAEVRKDFCHKTSAALVRSSAQVFAFEDLKLKNMTAAPKPKPDAKKPGRYAKNGAAAKAGLNKALLASSLGLIKQFTTYKAARVNKLVMTVPAAYSSQECAKCHKVHKDNRIDQAQFHCVNCGHTDNADHNAAAVVKYRAIQKLKAGEVVFKEKKTARVGRKEKVEAECLEPDASPKPVENLSAIEGSQAVNDAVFKEAGRSPTYKPPGFRCG